MKISIDGFLARAKRNANNAIYRGRFVCPAVQWTGTSDDAVATFTITANELADAASNGLLWTDQDVQRGIQPGLTPSPPRELSLANGYPDTTKYTVPRIYGVDAIQKIVIDLNIEPRAICGHSGIGRLFRSSGIVSGNLQLVLNLDSLPIRDLFSEPELIVPGFPEFISASFKSEGKPSDCDSCESRDHGGGVIKPTTYIPNDNVGNVVRGTTFFAGVLVWLAYLVVRRWV